MGLIDQVWHKDMPGLIQFTDRGEMSTITRLSVVLLAEPGYLRDGIVSILFSISMVGEVRVSSLPAYLASPAEVGGPDLFLIDCTGGQAAPGSVEAVKTRCPNGLIVTLIKDLDRYAIAQEWGASAVLLEGFTGPDLIKCIREVFAGKPGLTLAPGLYS